MGNLTDQEIRELATEYVTDLLYMAEDGADMMGLTETLDEEWFEEGISEDDLDQILEQARSDLFRIRDNTEGGTDYGNGRFRRLRGPGATLR